MASRVSEQKPFLDPSLTPTQQGELVGNELHTKLPPELAAIVLQNLSETRGGEIGSRISPIVNHHFDCLITQKYQDCLRLTPFRKTPEESFGTVLKTVKARAAAAGTPQMEIDELSIDQLARQTADNENLCLIFPEILGELPEEALTEMQNSSDQRSPVREANAMKRDGDPQNLIGDWIAPYLAAKNRIHGHLPIWFQAKLIREWLNDEKNAPLLAEIKEFSYSRGDSSKRPPLTGLPPELARLTGIEEVWLDSNQLTKIDLPDTWIKMRTLVLDRNQLKKVVIPNTWTDLTNLHITQNQLEEFSIPADCTNIEIVELDNNQLKYVDLSLLFTKLERIGLSSNQLKEFQTSNTWTLLKKFYLSDNRLTTINIQFIWKNLKELHLNKNELTNLQIPDELTQLEYVNVSDNPLRKIPISRTMWNRLKERFVFNNTPISDTQNI